MNEAFLNEYPQAARAIEVALVGNHRVQFVLADRPTAQQVIGATSCALGAANLGLQSSVAREGRIPDWLALRVMITTPVAGLTNNWFDLALIGHRVGEAKNRTPISSWTGRAENRLISVFRQELRLTDLQIAFLLDVATSCAKLADSGYVRGAHIAEAVQYLHYR